MGHNPQTIAIIEDHRLQRTYAAKLVQAQPDMTVVYMGEELPDLVSWLDTADPLLRPDLIVLDLMVERRPHAKPETVRQLIAQGYRVVLFSGIASPPLARQMVRAGVHGLIGKRESEETLLTALRSVLAGEWWLSAELAAVIAQDPDRPRLSDQEERALVLYASGLPMDDVASSIGVKRGTVKKYLQRVRAKYAEVGQELTSRVDWFKAAAEDGYLPLSSGSTTER